jgi:hypothetical protein
MTSRKELIPWGAAIAGDVMSKLMIPGGNSLSKLGEAYLQKKRKEAADILIEEIGKGSPEPIDFTESDADPLIEIVYRFSKAVSDGAARENLRLLAQIIAGLKRNKALEPDKFRKWANILEQLTRDELMVVGKAIALRRKMVAAGDKPSFDFFSILQEEMKAAGYGAEIMSLYASVSRTGRLFPGSAFGALVYRPSAWLDELGQLANVEEIVNAG